MKCRLRSTDHSEFPGKTTKKEDETANSTLLRVAIEEAKKRAEVWKAGLDVELIFVSGWLLFGIRQSLIFFQIAQFVAVIAAFLVPALQSLNDPTAQTNALLTNLTSVIVQIAALNGVRLPQMTQPEGSQSDTPSGILSFLWTTSLVLSVSFSQWYVLVRSFFIRSSQQSSRYLDVNGSRTTLKSLMEARHIGNFVRTGRERNRFESYSRRH